MQWFNITRSSGEKAGPGEFVVEDSEGVEWQVTAVMSTVVPGKVVCLNEIPCLNRMYLCNWELQYDLQDAVKELIEAEGSVTE